MMSTLLNSATPNITSFLGLAHRVLMKGWLCYQQTSSIHILRSIMIGHSGKLRILQLISVRKASRSPNRWVRSGARSAYFCNQYSQVSRCFTIWTKRSYLVNSSAPPWSFETFHSNTEHKQVSPVITLEAHLGSRLVRYLTRSYDRPSHME